MTPEETRELLDPGFKDGNRPLNEELIGRIKQAILAGQWKLSGSEDLFSPANLRGTLIRCWQTTHGGESPNEQQLAEMAEKFHKGKML